MPPFINPQNMMMPPPGGKMMSLPPVMGVPGEEEDIPTPMSGYGGRPLPPSVDPSQLSPQQMMQLKSMGFSIPSAPTQAPPQGPPGGGAMMNMDPVMGTPPPDPAEKKPKFFSPEVLGPLAGVLGAAIAGPDSGVGNFLQGGVSQYANMQMDKMLKKQEADSTQHASLIKTVMTKVPELSQMDPENPQVKKLQEMWADALSNDGVISPKEAANMSAMIHAIEGGVKKNFANTESDRKMAEEAKASQLKKDQEMWSLLQASQPSMQGVSFEEARNAPFFRKAMDSLQARNAGRADAFQGSQMGLSPVEVSGEQRQVPTLSAYGEQQAGVRSQQNADAIAGRSAATQGAIDDRSAREGAMRQAAQIIAAVGKNPFLIQEFRADGKTPNPMYNPQIAALYAQAQQLVSGAMTPPPAIR